MYNRFSQIKYKTQRQNPKEQKNLLPVFHMDKCINCILCYKTTSGSRYIRLYTHILVVKSHYF